MTKALSILLACSTTDTFIYEYTTDDGEVGLRYVGEDGEKDLYKDLYDEMEHLLPAVAFFNADGSQALFGTRQGNSIFATYSLYYADQDGNFEVIERTDVTGYVQPLICREYTLTWSTYQCKGANLLPVYYQVYNSDSGDWKIYYYSDGDRTRVFTSEDYYPPIINGNTVQYCKDGETYIGTLNGDTLSGEKKIADEAGRLYLKPCGTKGYIKGKKNIFYVENGSSEKVMKSSDLSHIYQSVSGNTAVLTDDDGNARIFRKAEEEGTIKRVDHILPTLRTEFGGDI